ncbi:hypothetical protein WG902_09495 [Ramlibacter sp. PS3R-8]|uniref:hypothetical protein n=1 Tax=Ramlibacter sp. PS3R-8 TaxID=3133437 RepID=UPI0030ABE846
MLPLSPYRVDVVAIGVLDDELELMSVGVPVPEAPMEVPLPVEPVAEPEAEPIVEPVLEPAVVSVLPVLGVVAMEPEPVVLPAVLGEVVEGDVLEVEGVEVEEDDEAGTSSFLPHALSDRAAMRARAAHCAMGDLIIRNS